MPDRFTFADAFAIDDGTDRLNVRVCFDNGAPSSVFFSDPDQNGSVSVPFDLWQRVIGAVDKAVDMNRTDGGAK